MNRVIVAVVAALWAAVAMGQESDTVPAVSRTLPVLYIVTQDSAEIVSKDEYLPAHYWLDAMGQDGVQALGSEAQPIDMEIRGRGHSSWKSDKKPYKIKLGTKTPLLGMASSKHWALLKPYEANVAGYELGRIVGMPWAPHLQPLEVVINGDYRGLYFLTETVRIAKNRVNIYEQEDEETDPDIIPGGWLVEIDNYRDNNQISIRENTRYNLTVRYHSPEVLSSEQSTWLRSEFTAMNAAIYSTDKTSTLWEQYIDVDAMARFFIVQEVMDNPDGFHGSFYLHKDLGDSTRWTAGPVWDLSCYYREKTDYTYAMKVHYTTTPHWIGEIIQYDSFCKAVGRIWNDIYPDKIAQVYDHIDSTMLPLAEAYRNNHLRWGYDLAETPQYLADKIKAALRSNIEWFNGHLPVSEYGAVIDVKSASATAVRVYNLQGNILGTWKNEADALQSLPAGLYIIGGKKVVKY